MLNEKKKSELHIASIKSWGLPITRLINKETKKNWERKETPLSNFNVAISFCLIN